MKFALYESLIRQLDQPEVIRLNYSGESLHYPRLAEAIRLARSTGATTEIVTALGSVPLHAIRAVVDNQLHRLSVSIHSLDARRYRDIYGRGSPADIEIRLDYLRKYQAERGSRFPSIDFAFVAMKENLGDLPAIAEYASILGVEQISIHPVIRRSAIRQTFSQELDEGGALRNEFSKRIVDEVEKLGSAKGLKLSIARPMVASNNVAGAGIAICEQNPWNTLHVLSDGSIVPCEVQDRTVVGNLHQQSLAEIWNGEAYKEFRRAYLNAPNLPCRQCAWRSTTTFVSGAQVPVRGWHPASNETVQWSESNAAFAIVVPPSVNGLKVEGLLPPSPDLSANTLSIAVGAAEPTMVVNNTRELIPFEVRVATGAEASTTVAVLTFKTKDPFCPAERNTGPDLRRLGFAMTGLSFSFDRCREQKVKRAIHLLAQAEEVARLRRFVPAWKIPMRSLQPGISVLIPARGTPDLLRTTLKAATVALSRVNEPAEIIAVVSETDGLDYQGLICTFPRVRWVLRREPLHYASAVECGLGYAANPWVYLLNSDMRLEPDAIASILPLRGPQTFAIGSRIVMDDGTATETNWTDLEIRDRDAVNIVERDPEALDGPRGCLYAGGGSGLFRRYLLRKFISTTKAYEPFYWEDVEWGTRAWLGGYECIFCPTSRAIHAHRQTVRRYYDESEVSRVFERNRLLYHMRNLSGVDRLEERMMSLDEQSWDELLGFKPFLQTLLARTQVFLAAATQDVLRDRTSIVF